MRYEITDNATLTTLDRLHTAAEREFPKIVRRMLRLSLRRVIRPFSRYLRPEDMSDAYIAISREKGRRIYNILRETRARTIIEFGTSFGISTIYLAAAARENGGRVITTELLPEKCAIARRNFAAAGVTEQIELREGDALETLKSMPATIDFLLIDG